MKVQTVLTLAALFVFPLLHTWVELLPIKKKKMGAGTCNTSLFCARALQLMSPVISQSKAVLQAPPFTDGTSFIFTLRVLLIACKDVRISLTKILLKSQALAAPCLSSVLSKVRAVAFHSVRVFQMTTDGFFYILMSCIQIPYQSDGFVVVILWICIILKSKLIHLHPKATRLCPSSDWVLIFPLSCTCLK